MSSSGSRRKLNQPGEICRSAGLGFCYHNHAFEFEPISGTTPFQVLMDNTDKKLVGLEMDVFWVSVGGHNPVELLHKLSGRVPLLHLKDKAEGTPVMYKESVPRSIQRSRTAVHSNWPEDAQGRRLRRSEALFRRAGPNAWRSG